MTTIRPWPQWSLEARIGLVAGLAAIAWSIVVLDPLGAATIDPDASSSVLYFERIVSGQRLEAFVPTTPKPFLTLVFGLTWALSHDWRALVWETMAGWGVAVGATAVLVSRLAGRGAAVGALAAAGFMVAALLVSSDLMLEVSRGNSLVWALAFWALAGLAVTAQPPRPALAGFGLLLAGLCRFETLALVLVALVALALAQKRSSRSAVGVGLAALAIPIALLHDWLLSGDPLYFLSVPGRYTGIFNPGLAPIDPIAFGGTFAGRLAPEWPLLLLAAVGVWAIIRSRRWLVLAAVAAIGVGEAGLLFVLAARATYISNRYYEPIDLAVIVSAAVGVGAIATFLAGARPAPGSLAPTVAAAAAALVLGIAVSWPALPFDRRASTELSDVRTASEHLGAVMPVLQSLVASCAECLLRPTAGILVPSRDDSRVVVEAKTTRLVVGDSYATLLQGGADALRPGDVLFHDAAADRPVALYTAFEIDDQAPVAGHILVRLDPREPGIWLLSVR